MYTGIGSCKQCVKITVALWSRLVHADVFYNKNQNHKILTNYEWIIDMRCIQYVSCCYRSWQLWHTNCIYFQCKYQFTFHWVKCWGHLTGAVFMTLHFVTYFTPEECWIIKFFFTKCLNLSCTLVFQDRKILVVDLSKQWSNKRKESSGDSNLPVKKIRQWRCILDCWHNFTFPIW